MDTKKNQSTEQEEKQIPLTERWAAESEDYWTEEELKEQKENENK